MPGGDHPIVGRPRRDGPHRRPAALLSTPPLSTPPVAGIDIGGTKLLGVVVDDGGRVLAHARRPTQRGPDVVLRDAAALLGELKAAVPEVAAAGVGVAGMVDLDGVMRFAPNLPGWEGVAVRERVATAAGLPVAVDNDANTAGLAEVALGAARGCSEALVITLGTGIGGAVVTGGRVMRGVSGLAAEVGHITVDTSPSAPRCACGAAGHWEAFASGTALGRLGRREAEAGRAPEILALAGGEAASVTGLHVGAAAQAGDPDAVALLDAYAELVALGLGSLVNVLDPEVVVIGGGLVTLGDTLLVPLRAALAVAVEGAGYRRLPEVRPAQLGQHAGAVGAALLAREAL